ncbi:MAG TPA: MBL fold metallo-hydrolase [Burkholderiaceae bacterium]|nr:MBL fold metallo-hydrolase [Burkholderiaceae bacterium]
MFRPHEIAALYCVAAMLAAAGCAATDPARGDGVVHAVEVARGVYMMQGVAGEVDNVTVGRNGNAGFIVGSDGVLAIDTGTSYRHGLALLAEIRRITDKPVRRVLITHTRQEFLFGAAAYRERGVPIAMHREAAQLMAARCENCLKTLRRVLGEDEMRGTAMFKPDLVFDASHELTLIGRPVRVLYFDHSAGPGDIAVLDEQTHTLFAGGLLDWKRIPDIQDSDLPGWHRALDELRMLSLATIVPGHGPAAGREAIDAVATYLNQLEARVLELLENGAALSEVPDATALPDFKDWDQYETIHRRNASVLFVRKEREHMLD